MNSIVLNVASPLLANGALFRISRVSSTHQLAKIRNRILLFQSQRNDGPARHEVSQRPEKRTARMHRIELLSLMLRDFQHLQSENAEAIFLELFDDVANRVLAHGVGFDDGKSALQSLHAVVCPWSVVVCKNLRSGGVPRAAARVSPIAAGDFATRIPADSKALIFSAAVPLPPEMMAPAWPMRRPGGAVWPAMNPTTGFFM